MSNEEVSGEFRKLVACHHIVQASHTDGLVHTVQLEYVRLCTSALVSQMISRLPCRPQYIVYVLVSQGLSTQSKGQLVDYTLLHSLKEDVVVDPVRWWSQHTFRDFGMTWIREPSKLMRKVFGILGQCLSIQTRPMLREPMNCTTSWDQFCLTYVFLLVLANFSHLAVQNPLHLWDKSYTCIKCTDRSAYKHVLGFN